jgi:hypothetical protein
MLWRHAKVVRSVNVVLDSGVASRVLAGGWWRYSWPLQRRAGSLRFPPSRRHDGPFQNSSPKDRPMSLVQFHLGQGLTAWQLHWERNGQAIGHPVSLEAVTLSASRAASRGFLDRFETKHRPFMDLAELPGHSQIGTFDQLITVHDNLRMSSYPTVTQCQAICTFRQRGSVTSSSRAPPARCWRSTTSGTPTMPRLPSPTAGCPWWEPGGCTAWG